jgi:hypothetical protein
MKFSKDSESREPSTERDKKQDWRSLMISQFFFLRLW